MDESNADMEKIAIDREDWCVEGCWRLHPHTIVNSCVCSGEWDMAVGAYETALEGSRAGGSAAMAHEVCGAGACAYWHRNQTSRMQVARWGLAQQRCKAMLRDWSWCIRNAEEGDFKLAGGVDAFVNNVNARSSGAVMAYISAAQHVPAEADRLKKVVHALAAPEARGWTFADPARAGARALVQMCVIVRCWMSPLIVGGAATIGAAALAYDDTNGAMDAVLAGLGAVPAVWCSLSPLSRMSRLLVRAVCAM